MAPVVLGYWALRGLGAPIVYVLEHTNTQYEYKNYSENPDGWFKEKFNMGLPFPNLPYLIDGDVKLAQSGAILKYLGRKHGLMATEEKDIQMQDQLEGILGDLRTGWAMLCYASQDFENDKKKTHDERIVPAFKQLDEFLAGKTYLIGNKLTIMDFAYFEFLDVTSKLYGTVLLDPFPNLKKLHETIGNLKAVKDYMLSPRAFEKINGPSAKWGG